MPNRPLSRFALDVLGKLAAGGKAIIDDDGDLRLNGRTIPRSVVETLVSQELARIEGRRICVTTVGVAHLRRRRTPRVAARTLGAFRPQHMDVYVRCDGTAAPRRRPLVNRTESPLGWLVRRRGRDGRPLLSERQYLAGERLREEFELAGLAPRLVRAYDAPPVARSRRGGAAIGAEASDRSVDARRRVQAALNAIGPGLSDILLRICCFLEGLEEAEQAIGWPARSGKVVLGLALDRLADFYEGKKMGVRERPVGKGMPG